MVHTGARAVGRGRRGRWARVVWLVVFGAAFGYVEAAVVHYLRRVVGTGTAYLVDGYRVVVDLRVIQFVRPTHPLLLDDSLTRVETGREAATIVMLVAVAVLAAHGWSRRLGAFLVAFATWDLTYYLWLRVLDGWPTSLGDTDVYFLIPVAWIGPVATPVVASLLVAILGVWLLARRSGRCAD